MTRRLNIHEILLARTLQSMGATLTPPVERAVCRIGLLNIATEPQYIGRPITTEQDKPKETK